MPYPSGTAASQRFRFEQYYSFLREEGWEIEKAPFLDEETWEILYSKGFYLKKVLGLLKGFLKRFFFLFNAAKYDAIFIHREAAPLGPPFCEWAFKVLGRKIIFDFDDAVWLSNTSKENKIISWIKFPNKIKFIIKNAKKVSAANESLFAFAKKLNDNIILNPTTIDTTFHHNVVVDQNKEELVIGWTGTHSTLKYLEVILPVIKLLEEEFKFTFLVIADKDPGFNLNNYKFIKWNKETEIEDLSKINIGIMPLFNDEWSKGKSGFKILQYFALGIPAVASPVGVNSMFIEEGKSGFLCEKEEDWYKALKFLLTSSESRTLMGLKGQKLVKENFSVESNRQNFLSLFK